MLIGDVRGVLIEYINSKFRIDEWGLGLPKSSSIDSPIPSIGLDKPTLDLIFEDDKSGTGNRERIAIATIPFQVMYRFDSSYSYSTLPRIEAENALNHALLGLLNCSLHPCIENIEPSGRVSVAETKNSDWLIIVELDARVRFIVSSELYKDTIF